MKNSTFLLAFLFYAFTGHAQTNTTLLTGKVVDESGEPLAGVTVTLKNKKTGTISDLNGSFKLNLTERDVVIFNYIGWATSEYNLLEIEREFKNIITLEATTIDLPECVISILRWPILR